MAILKKAEKPFSLHVVGAKGYVLKLLEGAGSDNWAAEVHTEGLLEVFGAEVAGEEDKKEETKGVSMTYMSPDSEELLEELPSSHNEVLVVGGFVDKTIMGEASLGRSQELHIKHAQLPLQKYCPEVRGS